MTLSDNDLERIKLTMTPPHGTRIPDGEGEETRFSDKSWISWGAAVGLAALLVTGVLAFASTKATADEAKAAVAEVKKKVDEDHEKRIQMLEQQAAVTRVLLENMNKTVEAIAVKTGAK